MLAEQQYDIEVMLNAYNLLESLPDELRCVEYKKILKGIHNYIINNCKHEYITDMIDVDVERSKTIVYCKKCYYTPNN
tara:strand:- start:1667 stop:1900 length:234 start_codon:yes stop_codon:yes gene_type:complete